jgi:hypothetical protein
LSAQFIFFLGSSRAAVLLAMKRQKTLNLIFGNSQDSQETQKQFIWAISEKGDDPSSEKKMGSLYVLEIYSDKLSTIL